jgi:hypothetical protein
MGAQVDAPLAAGDISLTVRTATDAREKPHCAPCTPIHFPLSGLGALSPRAALAQIVPAHRAIIAVWLSLGTRLFRDSVTSELWCTASQPCQIIAPTLLF